MLELYVCSSAKVCAKRKALSLKVFDSVKRGDLCLACVVFFVKEQEIWFSLCESGTVFGGCAWPRIASAWQLGQTWSCRGVICVEETR